MNRKKHIWAIPLTLALFAVGIWLLAQREKSDTMSRADYEAYLNAHPFNQSPDLPPGGLKAIPKKDRPDLAAEFEFLKTMDPELKRPARERLLALMDDLEASPQPHAVPGDAQNPWVEHGPNNVGGRTRALMFDPNDPSVKKVWAAGVAGGIWYNNDITDASSSWKKVSDFWDNINVSSLVYDPSNTQVFYAGTGEFAGSSSSSGGGIWKSTDGGNTWKRLTSTTPSTRQGGGSGSDWHYVARLAVAPNGDVFAGTRGYYTNRGGVYRSQDGGETWEKVLSRSNGRHWVLDIEAETSGSIYAAFSYPAALYKSTDGGDNWEELLSDSEADRLEFTVNDADSTIYALGASGDNSAGSNDMAWIKKLPNGTGDWEDLEIPLEVASEKHFTRGQAWYDLIVESHPEVSNTVIIGGISLHRSINGGVQWDSVSAWHSYYGSIFGIPTVHADQHNIVFRPGHHNEAIFSNDGGVYYSADVGNSAVVKPNFANRNKDYNVTQFYAVAQHPDKGVYQYLAGSQDNGTQFFTNNGINSTEEVTGGDGAFCFIDEDEPHIQISSYIYNSYWVTTNTWKNTSRFINDLSNGRFINPCDYDSKHNTLYAAYNKTNIAYYQGVDDNPSRELLYHNWGSVASELKFYRNSGDSSYLFVGTGSGRVFSVYNIDTVENAVITEITGASFPNGYISSIDIGKSQDEIVVSFSSYGVSSIWYTEDGGATWSEKEGNLPDFPVRGVLFNPNNPSEVLLATELGAWSTKNFMDATPTWERSNNGFSNTRVDMLVMRESDNQVVAATHGRGLFSSMAFQPVQNNAIINVTGDLAFGEQWEGTQTVRSMTIQSTGEEPILVNSIELPEGFHASWTSGEIGAGEEVVVDISCDILSQGSFGGTISVSSNAGQGTKSIDCSITIDTLKVALNTSDISCFGEVNGKASIHVSDYEAALTYSMGEIGFSSDTLFSTLHAGTHAIWIKSEADSFLTKRSFSIAEPDVLAMSVSNATEPNCFYEATGEVILLAEGGIEPYTYSLDGETFKSGNSFGELLPGAYEITVKDANGCTKSIDYSLGPDSLSVSIASMLKPSCSNLADGTLTVETAGGAAPYQYSTDGTSFSDNSTFSDLGIGDFQLTIRDAKGCTVQASVLIESDNQAPATPEVNIADGLEGISDILTLTSSVEADSYQWYVGGVLKAGATGKTYEVQADDFINGAGNFQVEVFTAAGCSELSAVQAITAEQADFFEAGLAVYPNPFSRKLVLDFNNVPSNYSHCQVYLFDMTGKQVFNQALSLDTKTKLDLSSLPKGTYLLKLQTGNHTLVRKVQKK